SSLRLLFFQRRTIDSSAPQDGEQNSIMGKLDEGLDDFFSKKVIKLSFKLPSVRGSPSSPQEGADKKRDSRKSGFFNLIKSRTSRSEKSHGAASITPPHAASSAITSPSPSITPVTEETTPTFPAPPPKSPVTVAEPHQEFHRAQSPDHTDSEVEASLTAAEPAEEEEKEEKENEESVENKEDLERRENPLIPRHIGVPVMGMDLLAEMKARQEKMAVRK
ncbi:F-actin-uncapping protein LRRC16A-like, partial [Plectropomus leopardus]|uniref:F-actin-uncapping protein LRRC16A-like n=1 Tax=Plectropomus leopardus TaxID=160734 RepID=UPI001C4AA548